jgi:hypothetical protein
VRYLSACHPRRGRLTRHRKIGEVFSFHFVLGHGLVDLLNFADMSPIGAAVIAAVVLSALAGRFALNRRALASSFDRTEAADGS